MTEEITRKRTCDGCGRDLTSTSGSYAWHYVLSGEWTPTTSEISYDPHPILPPDRHFCDERCLTLSFGLEIRPETPTLGSEERLNDTT